MPELLPDWKIPYQNLIEYFPITPIPNVKFPPINLQLNKPTYHKSVKVSPHSLPKSHGHSNSMNKLTVMSQQ